MNNNRLYLKNWPYNAALIMDELHNIVENNGGKVKPHTGAPTVISNHTLDSAIRKTTDRLNQLEAIEAEKPGQNQHRTEAIKQYRADLEKWQHIDNTPREVRHTTWSASYITFTLDNMLYYYDTDDNPFFEFHYKKTPIAKDGTVSRDAYLMEDKKEWLYDCFMRFDTSDADRKEAANLIYNMLVKAPVSEIYREKRRMRVPNMYNNGYHYETVYEKERREKVSF